MALTREEIDQIAEKVAQEVAITIRRYSQSYEAPKSIQEGLAQSMGEELTASMWYQLRARDAKEKGEVLKKDIEEKISQTKEKFEKKDIVEKPKTTKRTYVKKAKAKDEVNK